jgi:hypothetical protein
MSLPLSVNTVNAFIIWSCGRAALSEEEKKGLIVYDIENLINKIKGKVKLSM